MNSTSKDPQSLNSVAQLILGFFYLTISNEKRATEAATKALRLYRKKYNLITAIDEAWKTYKKNPEEVSSPSSFLTAEPGLNISWSPWTQFKKIGTQEEIFALALVSVGFDSREIAIGLNLSQGTINYRINNALLKLGELLKNGA